MACEVCQALEKRIALLEDFQRAASARLRASKAAGSAPVAWRDEWPGPGPEEIGASRCSAFRKGAVARHDGIPYSGCPYGRGSRGHDNSWRRGWKAMDRHEKSAKK